MVDLTYGEKEQEFHKLRTIVKRDVNEIVGITLPKREVNHLMGVYFRCEVAGTTIILTSGAKI